MELPHFVSWCYNHVADGTATYVTADVVVTVANGIATYLNADVIAIMADGIPI